MTRNWSILPAAGLLLYTAGCADLTVPNQNNPDRSRALADAENVQSLIGSAFVPTWNAQQWYDGPAMALSTMSWEHSASWGNQGMWQMSRYPREPWPNNQGWPYYEAMQYAWTQAYASAAPVSEALRAIEGGLVIEEDGADQTDRARAFAHYMLGYSLGTIALTYDRGFVVDENADPENLALVPYDELMEVALDHLQEAIDISNSVDFTLPESWINGNAVTSEQLARLAHSLSARYMAQVARYPDERAAVDWAAVIAHVDAGLQEDFFVQQEPPTWWDDIKIYGNILETWSRAAYPFWGRADVSGGYEEWMASGPDDREPFLIITPDQRYPQGATVEEQRENPGMYLINTSPTPFNPARGGFYQSYYRDARYDAYGAAAWIAPTKAFDMDEMQLLKAEGLYRLGDPGAAAHIVNQTRVEHGELPPVTADGVPSGPDSCVPQMPDGSCGDLFEALKYEKRVEVTHTHLGSWFFDSRGWGDLEEGTPVMLPIPERELQVLQMPVYTFGGVGGNCAAGASCAIPTTGGGTSAVKMPSTVPSLSRSGIRSGMH